MQTQRSSERSGSLSSIFWIIDLMRFGPFLDLQKLESENQKAAFHLTKPITIPQQITHNYTSKTMSWNRSSIMLIQNKSLDFIWPSRLSIEISHDIPWRLLLNFKIGTRAWGMNCKLLHSPEILLLKDKLSIVNQLANFLYYLLLYYNKEVVSFLVTSNKDMARTRNGMAR